MPIPKKIHYCWLSGEKMSVEALQCIESWKTKMPEYELILWDTNRFDINSVLWVREACQARKWACAADFIRLYAVYTEGGIYMDTDVYMRKSFDDFLGLSFFSAFEWEIGGIQAAVWGSIRGHTFVKSCMDWYNDKHFILSDGRYNICSAPGIYYDVAVQYGYKNKDEEQRLMDDMVIYPSKTLANLGNHGKESYAVHCCHGSWLEKGEKPLWNWNIAREKLSKNNFLRKILGKSPYKEKSIGEIIEGSIKW